MSVVWRNRSAEWILLAILVSLALATSTKTRSVNGSALDDVDDFVPYLGERFSTFDWNLLRILSKNNRGNLLVSPISLKLALVLLYEGAQDETAEELATVMHLPVGRSATRDKFSAILQSLKDEKPEYTLNLGTRIFLDKSILPRQFYGAIAKQFYSTDVFNTNFTETCTSAQMINNYVQNVTSGHIQKIIEDETKLKDNLMLIVSAMFFQGTWFRQPFHLNHTKVDKFYMSDGKTAIDVPFMRSSSKFYLVYAEELEAKILRLPYAGHKYAMFMILPQSPGKLDEVVKKITPYIINRHVWLMQEIPADIMIPKFKFDFTSHLESTLRELGIRDIFDDTATLTGILRSKLTSRRLIVTDIIQKAGIEVNERGTVTYTATEVEIGNKMNDESFHATHPFLFYIEDESSGTILYMGVVNNPLEQTGMVDAMPPRLGEPGTEPVNVPSILGTGIEERQNYFNIELMQKLNEANPGNVIVGSSSIKSALMVLAEAAAGKTRQQITSALRLPSDINGIRNLASYNINSFKDLSSGTELQTAIKLWLAKDVPLQQGYIDVLQRHYKGDLQSLNFNDLSGAAKTINDWANKCTRGRINSVVDPSTMAADTQMILTTTVYFKGTWQKAFDKKITQMRCFNVPNFGCHRVPLMENLDHYKYSYVPALDAQVIQIPYSGGRVSMMVLLPQRNEKQTLSDLSRNLAFTPISAILASLRDTEILLQLPRFSISSKLNLQAPLKQLLIQDMFDKKANFTTAFPGGNVMVNSITHNAQIEVSEEGTIAAAVTDISVIPLMGSTATTFRADRPFIFFLLDLQTNGILFGGRYVQPDAPTPSNPAAA